MAGHLESSSLEGRCWLNKGSEFGGLAWWGRCAGLGVTCDGEAADMAQSGTRSGSSECSVSLMTLVDHHSVTPEWIGDVEQMNPSLSPSGSE